MAASSLVVSYSLDSVLQLMQGLRLANGMFCVL